MCRIAGIIDKSADPKQIEQDVEAMCASMQHGGPDGSGLVNESSLALCFGHRRLALLDLSSSGQQPMRYGNNLLITFNGEIYNYPDLKKQLSALGYQFRTQTDTEVILAAYQNWGIKSFSKIEGMFAFALLDKEKKLSYLVRDQNAIKPLYYSTEQQRLVFSSEVKAFSKTSYVYTENEDWKTYFLAFGHIPAPYTTLKNVFSLKPGYFLEWSHVQLASRTLSFEHENLIHHPAKKAMVSKVLADKLNRSVKQHMIADAPIGVFLSGGLDSSIITLIANRFSTKNLPMVSINFAEPAYSEEKFQRLIAEHINGTHHSHNVGEADFNKYFKDILSAMDQPTSDGINSWFVNKFARINGLKAVLSGIGADEYFGGYPSFNRMNTIKYLKKLPRYLLKLMAKLPSEKFKRIYYLSYQNPIGEYLFLRGFFIPETIAGILKINRNEIDSLFENFSVDESLNKLSGKERVAWFETNIFMQNQLLKDTDFMSMIHGIEVRVPFLDKGLANYVSSLSTEQRFKKEPKGILVDAFKDILPESIWKRPKMGFSFPLDDWFLKGGQITDEKIFAGNECAVKQIRKFKSGKLHWSKAFALYQIAIANSQS
ncbi:asparagine synthase (glutamine-hydrolyzing) [Pedobacter sp. Leaf176]|uniref:asparagine synthase (glutamine-hydrolyzing) n=1 Tax=Pedobacter sp. Leaf176 TaxID=1736286 RepID=UPI0007006DAD|nr:asparagine synthase (glutamine-hydrolyzing) [Pedobacter sp. Leaf176]KQR72700.1 hypothetical protein ASF92_05345 [Pedobacter sp. Leaf176]